MKGAKILLGLLLMAFPCLAADISVTPTGPVYQLQPALIWGQSGPQGFNNNFYFTPVALNESVCVFVYNNNSTNAHAFTASIQVTGNPAEVTPSDNTWQSTASSSSLTAFISPGAPAGIGGQVSGAAKVSINFSASVTQAGSPDTASITIVQTPGNCFAGGQMLSSSPGTVNAVQPIQAISEALSQAFSASNQATNPGATSNILEVTANGGNRTGYLSKLFVSSTVAASITVSVSPTCTGSCANIGSGNLNPSGSNASVVRANSGTGTTAAAGLMIFNVAANATVTIDLSGIILASGTTATIVVTNNSAITGVENATIFWYEK